MPSQETLPQVIEQEKEMVQRVAKLTTSDKLEFIDTGWTSRVYLINDGQFVFKFPRAEPVKEEYRQEIAIARVLEQVELEVQVPKLRWIAANMDYIGYEGIRGTELARVAKETVGATKIRIGQTIGGFLKRLHRIELDRARVMTIDDEIKEFQYKYRLGLPIIRRDFAEEEQAKLKVLIDIEMPSTLRRLGSDPVVCHGDLGYWNMILKPNGEIGVIDFGDVGYYDRSKDFIGLQEREVLDEALKTYGDRDLLRQKVTIRQKVLAILDLPFFIGKGDEAGIAATVARIKAGLA